MRVERSAASVSRFAAPAAPVPASPVGAPAFNAHCGPAAYNGHLPSPRVDHHIHHSPLSSGFSARRLPSHLRGAAGSAAQQGAPATTTTASSWDPARGAAAGASEAADVASWAAGCDALCSSLEYMHPEQLEQRDHSGGGGMMTRGSDPEGPPSQVADAGGCGPPCSTPAGGQGHARLGLPPAPARGAIPGSGAQPRLSRVCEDSRSSAATVPSEGTNVVDGGGGGVTPRRTPSGHPAAAAAGDPKQGAADTQQGSGSGGVPHTGRKRASGALGALDGMFDLQSQMRWTDEDNEEERGGRRPSAAPAPGRGPGPVGEGLERRSSSSSGGSNNALGGGADAHAGTAHPPLRGTPRLSIEPCESPSPDGPSPWPLQLQQDAAWGYGTPRPAPGAGMVAAGWPPLPPPQAASCSQRRRSQSAGGSGPRAINAPAASRMLARYAAARSVSNSLATRYVSSRHASDCSNFHALRCMHNCKRNGQSCSCTHASNRPLSFWD